MLGAFTGLLLGSVQQESVTWLKAQGIDDALIQPYSGHTHRASLEVYFHLALADAEQRYDEVIDRFRSDAARETDNLHLAPGRTSLASTPTTTTSACAPPAMRKGPAVAGPLRSCVLPEV
jgi:hypothetical protein